MPSEAVVVLIIAGIACVLTSAGRANSFARFLCAPSVFLRDRRVRGAAAGAEAARPEKTDGHRPAV